METKIVLQRHTKLGRISAGARSALIARAEFGPVVTSRVNTLRPALHYSGANVNYRCDWFSTIVASQRGVHKFTSCISANQNCSRLFLRVTVEKFLLHQPLKSSKLQYKYSAVFCDFWTGGRRFPKVMADESEAGDAGVRELYADSDSGDDFDGFDAETVQRAEATLAQTRTRRNDTESDTDNNASDRESSDSGSESSDGGAGARHTTRPAAGNIRRGRGQIRGRGRNGDSLGPTASGSGSATPTVPTLADGTEIEWQADSGECGANWMRQLPNDPPLGKPAFFPTMNLRPIDFFMRTFPLALLTLLCTETNRYFADSSRQPTMNDAIRKAWVDVDVPEMKAFISELIVMGLCRRFSYRSYWSTNWLLDMPGFRSILPRDRFFAILRFLHLSDNSSDIPRGQPGHDRAFKIRPMISSLVEAWQDSYDIEKSVSVDECMIAFKGRVSMRQYMPKKPSKWGLKGWVLAG